MAFDLLQKGDFVTKSSALQVLRLIPTTEWTAKHGGATVSFGSFQRASPGIRSASRRYPLTTRLLTRLVRHWSPDTAFTTVTVLDNVRAPPHTDGHNSEVPGMIMSLTQGHQGGELWLAHDKGDATMLCNGIPQKGIKIDVTTPFLFSAKSIMHATCEWQGDRVVIAAYSTANSVSVLSQALLFRLAGMGFRPPTPEEQDRFRHETWGATVTRQLRFEPRAMWPAGALLHHAPITIDLDDPRPPTILIPSDTESDVISMCMGAASPEPDYWDCVLSDPDSELDL
eukprot:s8935_g1.t1